ncbi:hypothetical protein [Shewanella sp. CG12_big_fil_rev_8_21_14_0_65_47_15]|uniref:hypothetical protein n=1 Tax=Shewanella sp. CG12_big_fil_rev_8_21_14_0_65_47_15 TaxID=1975537 RepID=UPI0025D91D24|nr:hypothetical protein [Shewanella sp. CG12_big_fil_rev_8_21_14_0_65_47_15]
MEKRDWFAEKLSPNDLGIDDVEIADFEIADFEIDSFDTKSDTAGDTEGTVIAIAYCCFYKLPKLHGHG